MNSVRILIADESEAVRKSLKLALETEPGFVIVGEATNGREVARLVRRLRPHVVLLEPFLAGLDGLEALKYIVQMCPRAAVIAYSVYGDDEDLTQAMLEGGAAALLTKGVVSLEQLIAAIRLAVEPIQCEADLMRESS